MSESKNYARWNCTSMRSIAALLILVTLAASSLVTTMTEPQPVQGSVKATSKSKTPYSGEESNGKSAAACSRGFLPPQLEERVATYRRLNQPGSPAGTAQAESKNQAQRSDTSLFTNKSMVLIYDARQGWGIPGYRARFENAGPVADPVVNNAYDYHKDMRRFLKKVFKRDSLDAKGMDLVGTVHYGTKYVNAGWNGQQMMYGDGDGHLIESFVILDVIGHEMMHGVTEHTSKLFYYGQPGALNEHISDVFGVLLRQWKRNASVDKDSWLIGLGLFSSKVNGRALRDMRFPGTAYNDQFLGKDDQPGHMKNYVVTYEDNGGVHINSGIPNRAFALFAISLGGKAWKTAGKIWFEVSTAGHIKRDCDFQAFANKTVEVCTKMSPKDVGKLKAAWAAVGIVAS